MSLTLFKTIYNILFDSLSPHIISHFLFVLFRFRLISIVSIRPIPTSHPSSHLLHIPIFNLAPFSFLAYSVSSHFHTTSFPSCPIFNFVELNKINKIQVFFFGFMLYWTICWILPILCFHVKCWKRHLTCIKFNLHIFQLRLMGHALLSLNY